MKVIEMEGAKMEEQTIRAVLYGPAGSGKTHLLREFPTPMVVYDFDGKYEPLLGVTGITVKSFFIAEKKDCLQAWKDFWAEYKKDKKDDSIKTLAFDSLTALDNIVWNACILMMGKNPDDKRSYQAFTLPLYGDLKSTYETLFNSFKSAGKHVIVLAHEQAVMDENGMMVSISPLLSGSMKDRICAIFKDTWYLETKGDGKNMKRILHYKKYKYRTCTSVMMNGEDGRIEEPTYEKILANYRQ